MAPVCAVVVAGGSGQRFGNPGGKQLVNVAGRPLMSWSIRAFDRSDKVGHIVVVCPAERRAEMRRLAIDPFDYDTPISFADAGDTRQDSTRAGVHAVPAGFEYGAIVDGRIMELQPRWLQLLVVYIYAFLIPLPKTPIW